MKRAISSFLLLIFLLAAIQPTLVFHYCGGSFHSVGLTTEDVSMSCCGDAQKSDRTENAINQSAKNCCSNYTINIATDNYQSPKQSTSEIKPLIIAPVVFLCNSFLKENIFTFSSLTQTAFPSGGIFPYDGDILTLNCVFRI